MKRYRFFLCLVICFALFLTGMLPRLSEAGLISIRSLEKAEVDGDVIHLGQIARIGGDDPALVQRLKRIVIARAPLPGKGRHLNENYIRLRLKQEKIDLSQMRLEAPRGIEVIRGFVEITKEDIKRAVSDFIYASIPWDREKVKIRDIWVRDNVILPKGKISYSVEPVKNTDFKGSVPLPIRFKVDGNLQKRILVTADIDVFAEVVVTKRPLRRHRRITEDDVEIREKNLAELPSNIILEYEEVLGKRAKRNISANTVLRPDLIEFPPLVKRGDVVLLIAESSGLRITALGMVKQREGRRGERIRVENIDSKKSLYGRVLDSRTVKVDF
ncbi:MAG: flagellar basal body P-ring formation protein FlgA [Deltaproteobacteria bacterium]|nr:flagellar basal body P-ring formation protein FlgA [Deltaproteobacteria bacterium]MBW2050334.1 flagellar basal body P-ring formation protein FlgA [Deltaproteobacteria bacterium]MBW2112898.1 flagellar basal body P-ring formation protein FlgA [Deltaproteobacteria bacterium]MBW2354963.1 flagellar basal body P-ring formation protein FlgA [Deltaproteobacteria bacterium]